MEPKTGELRESVPRKDETLPPSSHPHSAPKMMAVRLRPLKSQDWLSHAAVI